MALALWFFAGLLVITSLMVLSWDHSLNHKASLTRPIRHQNRFVDTSCSRYKTTFSSSPRRSVSLIGIPGESSRLNESKLLWIWTASLLTTGFSKPNCSNVSMLARTRATKFGTHYSGTERSLPSISSSDEYWWTSDMYWWSSFMLTLSESASLSSLQSKSASLSSSLFESASLFLSLVSGFNRLSWSLSWSSTSAPPTRPSSSGTPFSAPSSPGQSFPGRSFASPSLAGTSFGSPSFASPSFASQHRLLQDHLFQDPLLQVHRFLQNHLFRWTAPNGFSH